MARTTKKNVEAEVKAAETVKADAAAKAVKEEKPVKAAAKTAEKKPAAKKPAAKKAAAPKTTKPAAAKTVATVYIQQGGAEVTAEALVEKAKADAGVKNAKNVDVYVRPEINMVYYVIDGDKFGNFELC